MEGEKIISYKDLIVWQKSMDLVLLIYQITKNFPKEELFGLVSQMRRAVVSIPSNIAEGKTRGSRKDYRHFLLNSFASGSELETQLLISKRLDYFNMQDFEKINFDLTEVMKMLNTLIYKLN
ncbi:MAG: four helix bundle protein [Candidatus Magasanikbacteria bacterium]